MAFDLKIKFSFMKNFFQILEPRDNTFGIEHPVIQYSRTVGGGIQQYKPTVHDPQDWVIQYTRQVAGLFGCTDERLEREKELKRQWLRIYIIQNNRWHLNWYDIINMYWYVIVYIQYTVLGGISFDQYHDFSVTTDNNRKFGQ